MMVRPPILRLAVAIDFAAPAAIASYALVHGTTRHAVPCDIWRMIFCLVGGGLTGLSALIRIEVDVSQTLLRSRRFENCQNIPSQAKSFSIPRKTRATA